MRRLARLALLAFAVLVALAAWQASRIMPIGAGYIAKNLCSEHFLAGRENVDRIWTDIGDVDGSFNWGSYELDPRSRTVTAWFLPGLMKATAVYRDGLGCTLAAGSTVDELRNVSILMPTALSE